MESHDISSPPLPALYHEAMLAYHAYTVRGKPGENFLKFWYHMETTTHNQSTHPPISPSEVSDYTIDILRGILILRDEVVAISSPKIGTKFFRKVLTRIRNTSVFPESVEYWNTVMSGRLDFEGEGVSVNEVSEATFQFLKSLASADTVSKTTSDPSATDEELQRLRLYVQQSLEKLRQEVAKETEGIKVKLDEVATAQSTPRPTVPELPIPSRRRVRQTSGTSPRNPPARVCCGHDNNLIENCLIQ